MLAHLPDRAVLAVSGADRLTFLQGLVSNDMTRAGPDAIVWSAILTPQGKWFSDFFVFADETRFLLDVPRDHAQTLVTRLSRFRLRADVAIAVADVAVMAAWEGGIAPDGALAAADPRHPGAGLRALMPDAARAQQAATADAAAYDRHRLGLGLPDAVDCEQDRTLLLEANFDLLHGVSWSKGCYMGQELTARTHYRGLVRKRLIPVEGSSLPPAGTPLLDAQGKPCGTMRSHRDTRGLAFVRTEAWDAVLRAEGSETPIAIRRPDWLVIARDAS